VRLSTPKFPYTYYIGFILRRSLGNLFNAFGPKTFTPDDCWEQGARSINRKGVQTNRTHEWHLPLPPRYCNIVQTERVWKKRVVKKFSFSKTLLKYINFLKKYVVFKQFFFMHGFLSEISIIIVSLENISCRKRISAATKHNFTKHIFIRKTMCLVMHISTL